VERAVLAPEQLAVAAAVRRLMAAYRDARELIEVGAYAPGSDPDVDLAIRLRPALDAFARQSPQAVVPADQAWHDLSAMVAGAGLLDAGAAA